MNKNFELIPGSDWLTKQDRDDFSRYLYIYHTYIENNYGSFSWEDETFLRFCKENSIHAKENRATTKKENYFWFKAQKNKKQNQNDIAHHFLRHIRNSIAHGLIKIKKQKKNQKYYVLQDFEKNGEQSMGGIIRSDLLWKMLWLLYNTRKI